MHITGTGTTRKLQEELDASGKGRHFTDFGQAVRMALGSMLAGVAKDVVYAFDAKAEATNDVITLNIVMRKLQ